jgi:FdhE protein
MTPATTARLDALARAHPDWAPYVALVRETAGALARTRHHPGAALAASVACTPARSRDDAPLFAGAAIAMDDRALRTWVLHLLRTAADHGAASALGDPNGWLTLDARAVAQAALDEDTARTSALAAAAGMNRDALASIAHLAIVPVLHACRRAHERALPGNWPRGSCPACGAWATLAEARGLDRSLRLRCARCGADWPTEWLRCVFCGNRDHETLGSLVADGTGETRRVETCETCGGYLKTIATLTAIASADLLLEDLATVDLDLSAIERGYRRGQALLSRHFCQEDTGGGEGPRKRQECKA